MQLVSNYSLGDNLTLLASLSVPVGASGSEFGGIESLARLLELDGLNHRVEAVGGVLAEESAAMMQDFFRRLRAAKAAEAAEGRPPAGES